MTTRGGRCDQRWIGSALLALAAVSLLFGVVVAPLLARCDGGAPCVPLSYVGFSYLAIPLLWVGLFFLVVGSLPETETDSPARRAP